MAETERPVRPDRAPVSGDRAGGAGSVAPASSLSHRRDARVGRRRRALLSSSVVPPGAVHGERGLADEERVAVIVPCLDEAITIGKVVDDWRRALPDAEVWVIDNGSSDGTAEIAEAHGARVIHESRRGKGFAMRTAFRRVDADVYVMVDGDDTYPAEAAEELLAPVREGRADMTVGSRLMQGTSSEFRALNRLANWFYPFVIRMLVHVRLTDVLSGMRAMTREFVEGVPLVAQGFEIEVELTVKAAERHFRIVEVPIDLRPRPEGSFSKVSLVGDGSRVLWTIVMLFRDYRPMAFFGGLGLGRDAPRAHPGHRRHRGVLRDRPGAAVPVGDPRSRARARRDAPHRRRDHAQRGRPSVRRAREPAGDARGAADA